MSTQLEELNNNFLKLGFDEKSIKVALNHIKLWLVHPEFEIYKGQVEHLINSHQYAELFDSFYQVIPFGTAGRRGKVGIGYNRINQWTIAATAQGHSQYLLSKFKEKAKSNGVVIAYDVRQYTKHDIYNNYITNPIWGLTSKEFAEIAATVYSKNGIKVHFFNEIRSTPQLSFTIRELEAVSGINITASHNPPEYNGIKVYDNFGGQIVPPYDQILIDQINNDVNIYDVEWDNFERSLKHRKVNFIPEKIEHKYISAVKKISLSRNRLVRIVYSPLHGTGKTSVYKVLKNMDFDVHLEPEGSIPSGEFESVPNQIPDPANLNVYWNSMNYARNIDANLIITSDPDADRVGVMVKDKHKKWILLDGNEMCILLTYFVIEKFKRLNKLNKESTIFSTVPVTKLLNKIVKYYDVSIKDDIYPGFKYIAHEMNELDSRGEIDNFLLGLEDTYGHISGSYARDKDACAAAILLSQFAGELQTKNLTLIDALEGIYTKFGFHKLTTTQIKFKYSYEKAKLESAFKILRKLKTKSFDKYKVTKFIDHLKREEIKSETDKSSRDLLEFYFEGVQEFEFFRVCLRPSGTEPVVKIYIEIGTNNNLEDIKLYEKKAYKLLRELSEYFVSYTQKLMETDSNSGSIPAENIVYLEKLIQN